mmetsp:Transcript_58365/g.189070  ORF Transcript_58365/g.189070 Transcript_58365/m.189070 type:complete len:209 (+) Transcript_58365:70-696(+)
MECGGIPIHDQRLGTAVLGAAEVVRVASADRSAPMRGWCCSTVLLEGSKSRDGCFLVSGSSGSEMDTQASPAVQRLRRCLRRNRGHRRAVPHRLALEGRAPGGSNFRGSHAELTRRRAPQILEFRKPWSIPAVGHLGFRDTLRLRRAATRQVRAPAGSAALPVRGAREPKDSIERHAIDIEAMQLPLLCAQDWSRVVVEIVDNPGLGN